MEKREEAKQKLREFFELLATKPENLKNTRANKMMIIKSIKNILNALERGPSQKRKKQLQNQLEICQIILEIFDEEYEKYMNMTDQKSIQDFEKVRDLVKKMKKGKRETLKPLKKTEELHFSPIYKGEMNVLPPPKSRGKEIER